MVAILFLVGRKLEQPAIVDWLLDINKCPAAPAYAMASDKPLLFMGGAFLSKAQIDFAKYREAKGSTAEHTTSGLARVFQRRVDGLRKRQAMVRCAMEIIGVNGSDYVLDWSYEGLGECTAATRSSKARK